MNFTSAPVMERMAVPTVGLVSVAEGCPGAPAGRAEPSAGPAGEWTAGKQDRADKRTLERHEAPLSRLRRRGQFFADETLRLALGFHSVHIAGRANAQIHGAAHVFACSAQSILLIALTMRSSCNEARWLIRSIEPPVDQAHSRA